ncbi:translocation/assembly module TamB domain-containing protein [Pseudoxanthomonas suwonensis]|uniref:Pathogenicity protein n=1 Tax=Pseudoxanthomonas suwonensis TaxID=314722 RepID=A0A0E3UNB9_9GAMM|nr:translocation/assembly module TamB domain-containing protein [Pseudoxanthomonas suwonensis]AKC86825.1 pathogenicity protein [Pseudoxanthomonas suwonensis]
MSTPAPPPPAPRPRFYRRRRFWAWSGLGVLALVVGALVLLYWLLQTVAGRDVLLAQIISRLPVGASLTWEKVEGPIAGPLTIHGLDFRYDDYRFTARRAYLDPDIRPLLGRRLRLDALEIEGATLSLVPSDEPFELPRWPGSLPPVEMPLAIQADHIVIDGFTINSGGEHVIDIRHLRGGIDIANGSLHAEHLQIDSDRGLFGVHGSYEPVRDYRSDILVTAVLPAPRGRNPARLGLIARGDLSKMEVGIGGRAPDPLRATLTLGGDADAPTWRLVARSEGLDPALLTGGEPAPEPIRFDLQASGTGGNADLSGQIGQGARQLTIAPSNLHLEDQVLTVAPLALELQGGQVVLKGRADFTDPEDGRFRFSLAARDLTFEAEDPATPAIGVDAALGLAGSINQWAVYGDAVLRRGGEQADLVLDVRGDRSRATIHSLQATMPTGTLQASGEAGWDPVLDWDLALVLDGFDPGYFAPGWDGNIHGRIATTGRARDGGGFDAQAVVQSLGGQLRGRALSGNGRFVLRGDEGQGELALALGNSRVRADGRVGSRIDVTAELQPLHLDDLLPTAAGIVEGSLRLTGTRQAPNLQANLTGRGLYWDERSANAVDLSGYLPWRGGDGNLTLQARELQVGIPLRQLTVHAQGAVENLRLQLQADSPDMAGLSFAGQVQRRGAGWQGSLDQLRIEPALGNAWSLQAPAAFTVAGQRWQLQPACLGVSGGNGDAQLCAHADWPREGLVVTSERLPLTLLAPWLPQQGGRALVLRGDLTLDARIRPQGNRWTGGIHLASLEGGLRLGNNARREIARYDHFSFDLTFDPQTIQGRLGTGFQGNGYIDATFATGWEPYSPLTGELYTHISQLFWLELFSPDLVRPRGIIRGHMSLRGTRGEPLMAGQLLLEDFQGELPALGLSLTDGQGSLDAQPDGSARLSASVSSGGGKLMVDGSLSWFGQATPLQLHIHGQDVLVADTPMLRATANPDVEFSMDGPTMVLRGQVEVTDATVHLERFEQGVSVSEDVVVVDPIDPEERRGTPLDMDLALILANDVTITGYGLQGTMNGRLQVRARPGHEMVATGALEVGGRYRAYGQDLTITNGQLTWSNNLIADPRINVRAERRVGDVVAGIDVSGHAMAPQLNVWSNPAMPQSEALAYLMLGRSLEGATRDQAQQVTATSAALSAGTGLIAAQLGTRLGFDDAGVMHSRALGGSVVGVGKYLSPRLYVGYGVSMVGAGQVVILKYLLRKGFDVELESSTVETRTSINWRTER